MPVEQNKKLVRRFFNEALDRNDVGLLDVMFNENCVFYRGDLDEPVRGIDGVRAIVGSERSCIGILRRKFIR